MYGGQEVTAHDLCVVQGWVEKEKKVEFLVEVLVGMGRKEELIKGKTCI